MEANNKRKPKGPITFEIDLNEEQREAKETILNSKITVLTGKAGSGKTLVAILTALDLLFRREIDKIILSRPAVTAGEEVGIMPGSMEQKLAPYVAPLVDALYTIYNRDKIDSLIHEGLIEVIPVGLMRGRNLSRCVAVIDESQNITHKQMKLMLTRLCNGSKMILCGDTDQIDLKEDKLSGFDFIATKLAKVPGFSVVNLKKNHRDDIVEEILNVYNEYNARG